MKHLSLLAALLALPTAGFAATTIVQWGEPGGDLNIIPTGGNGDNTTVTTTFNAGSITDAVGPAYYSMNTDRTPLFGGATGLGGKLEVRSAGNGDYFSIPFNTGTASPGNLRSQEAIYTWDASQILGITTGARLTSFSVESRLRQNNSSTGATRFLVEEAGQWYISQPSALPGNASYGSTTVDPITLSWNLYTPHVAGSDTIGAAAFPSLIGVDSVGLYTETINSNGNWAEVRTRYFQVQIPEPSRAVLLGVGLLAVIARRRRP